MPDYRYAPLNDHYKQQLEELLFSSARDVHAALQVHEPSAVVQNDYRSWSTLSDDVSARLARMEQEHDAEDARIPYPAEFDSMADIGDPLAHDAFDLQTDLDNLHELFGGRFAPRSTHLDRAGVIARPVLYGAATADQTQQIALNLLHHDGDWGKTILETWPQTNPDVLQEALHLVEAPRRKMLIEHAAARGVGLDLETGEVTIPDEIALARRPIAAIVQQAALGSGRQDARVTPGLSTTSVRLTVGSTSLNIEYAPAGPAHTVRSFDGTTVDHHPGPSRRGTVQLDHAVITCTEVLYASSESTAYAVAIGGRRVTHSIDDATHLLQRWINDEARRQDHPAALSDRLRNMARTTAIHRPAAADQLARVAREAVAQGKASATPQEHDVRTAGLREQLAQVAPGPSRAEKTIVVPAPAETSVDDGAREAARLMQAVRPTNPQITARPDVTATRPATTGPSHDHDLSR